MVDSKAYFVAFKTLMSIIFQADYSIAFFLFIICSRRSKMVGKKRKIRLENIDSRPSVRHFSYLIISCERIKLTPLYYPLKITTHNTDSDWFIDPLTTEEV